MIPILEGKLDLKIEIAQPVPMLILQGERERNRCGFEKSTVSSCNGRSVSMFSPNSIKAIVSISVAFLMAGSGIAADMTLDNLTVNNRIGIGTASPGFQLDVLGATRADEFIIFGAHIGNYKIFLREAADSTGEIYGPVIRNWAGAPWLSTSTHISIYTGDPTADIGTSYIMDGSTSGETGELRIGSYSYANSSIVLFPGEQKVLTATAEGGIGIGTDEPRANLEVVGTVIFSRQGDILMGEFGNPE